MLKQNQSAMLTITDMDAAIILKSDGTLQASLPEIMSEEVPDNVFTGAAVMYALNDPEICKIIYQSFAQECARQRTLSGFEAPAYHC